MTRITAQSLSEAQTGTSPTLLEVMPRFRRHLAAENKAPRTITSYVEAVHRLNEFVAGAGMPTRVSSISRDHVEAFMEDQLARLRPASARVRYASLRQFFAWLEDDGELTSSPMAKMRPPAVPEIPVPVLRLDDLKALLGTVEKGADFLARRDAALVRLFVDTGARLAEISGLKLEDVNLDVGTIKILGKGRRERILPIGSKTVRALDRYLGIRDRHPDRVDRALWLGTQGPMTPYGIDGAMRRRAKQAGIPAFHVHMLRHCAAHYLRLAGVDDDSVMRLMGWRDRSMLHRYGASAADERAHAAHRRAGLGDRL
jgi:site-specific recombinase XerD